MNHPQVRCVQALNFKQARTKRAPPGHGQEANGGVLVDEGRVEEKQVELISTASTRSQEGRPVITKLHCSN